MKCPAVPMVTEFDPRKHHRRSIRMKGYDYTQPGAYFVSLVAWQRECLFGKITDGNMQLNDWGNLAQNEWRRLASRFENIQIDEFVVMPNHLHGIIIILDSEVGGSIVGARLENSPSISESSPASPLRLVPGSLGSIVGAYKSVTARLINGIRHTIGSPVWQRNYYERIIRGDTEWARIRRYIHNNPREWDIDRDNPQNP